MKRLGLGCMRFPKKGSSVDLEAATALVQEAVRQGVTYLDTAYIYGDNERLVGQTLTATGLRPQVQIATKLPLFLCKTTQDLDRFFQKQLERLQTDYVDYYLLHMLSGLDEWQRLQSLGIEDFIARKLQSGEIRHIGFSFHGGRHAFTQLIDAYPWNFCMIQYNYLDEYNQAGKAGLHYAYDKKIPVFVMEPLRGGTLVTGLPEAATSLLCQADPDRSPAGWGMKWLFDQPEISMVLSGMNSLSQLSENLAWEAETPPGSLTPAEREVYQKVVAEIQRKRRVPCTGCGYCIPCPFGVDIPTCFAAYNERYTSNFRTAIRHYIMNTDYLSAAPTYASRCTGCGKCEQHCPQQIAIRKELAHTKKTLESFWFRPTRSIARAITRRK